jgi:hypothetical protein
MCAKSIWTTHKAMIEHQCWLACFCFAIPIGVCEPFSTKVQCLGSLPETLSFTSRNFERLGLVCCHCISAARVFFAAAVYLLDLLARPLIHLARFTECAAPSN